MNLLLLLLFCFLAECRTRGLNQVLIVLLFIMVTLRIVSFCWYVFCLLVVLVKLSSLAK